VADYPLHDAWQAGRAAWPGVELELARFAAFVANLSPGAASRFPTDIYLAAACAEGDQSALVVFDREVLAPARGTIRRIDPSDDFADEAFQQLRESLFVGDGARPRIAGYAGRGPLRAWVGVSAVRIALAMRRSRIRAKEVVADDDWSSALGTISTHDPELELFKQQYAAAFSRALRGAIEALEPRLRAVLRLSFVDAASIDEIASVYSVHRATAARWIQRACDAVFAHTRHDLAQDLALSGTELDRMTALIQSQLDVSISQLLPEPVE